MMISLTRTNGITVRLDSNLDVARETAEFTVKVIGSEFLYREFSFTDFREAARVYKNLAASVDEGTYTDEKGDNVAKAITLHQMVKEVA